MPQYGITRPTFGGVCAEYFILGVLRGSVHGELSVREILNRVNTQWGQSEAHLDELMAAFERLENAREVFVLGHHQTVHSQLVKLSRKR